VILDWWDYYFMPVAHSVQRSLRDAVVARLLEDEPLARGKVVAHQRRPMAQQDDMQVFVSLTDSPASPQALGKTTEWSTRIRVDCVARDGGEDKAEDIADVLAVEVQSRVMRDPRFDGKALDAVCHMSWADDDMESGVAACQVLVIVRHRTSRADASVAA